MSTCCFLLNKISDCWFKEHLFDYWGCNCFFKGFVKTWCGDPRYVRIALPPSPMYCKEFVMGFTLCLTGEVINLFFPLTFYLGIDYIARCNKKCCCGECENRCIVCNPINDTQFECDECFNGCFPFSLVLAPFTVLHDVVVAPLIFIQVTFCLKMCTYECVRIIGSRNSVAPERVASPVGVANPSRVQPEPDRDETLYEEAA